MRDRHCTLHISRTFHNPHDRVSEDLGSGHQEDICDPGCSQAHRYFYVRTDARSAGPGRRAVDLKVDLHPRLRVCSFDGCLGIPEDQLEVVCSLGIHLEEPQSPLTPCCLNGFDVSTTRLAPPYSALGFVRTSWGGVLGWRQVRFGDGTAGCLRISWEVLIRL